MKVLLICSGGMSSAMVVKTLVNEGKKNNIEIISKAVGTGEFETEISKDWEAILIAPQIRHKFDEFKSIADEKNIPIEVIETKGYSPLGGKILLEQVKQMIK